MTRQTNLAAETASIAPIQMASGQVVDLAALSAADIHWPDLVENLVKLPRFNGATPHVTYTTAQHCCLMYDRAPDGYKPQALLADFHAAYFGELTRSFLHLAAHYSGEPDTFLDNIHFARDRITAAIYEAAGLAFHQDDEQLDERLNALMLLDKMQTASEVRDLMAPCRTPGHWRLPAPFPVPVKPWGQDKSRTELTLRLAMIGVHIRG